MSDAEGDREENTRHEEDNEGDGKEENCSSDSEDEIPKCALEFMKGQQKLSGKAKNWNHRSHMGSKETSPINRKTQENLAETRNSSNSDESQEGEEEIMAESKVYAVQASPQGIVEAHSQDADKEEKEKSPKCATFLCNGEVEI
ncbi:unnamed protein product [Allacma fusca]|uniref:Uncharacterized protein n=1 Tax=Allacma fusca TaxID=39272 RepID=A0A8J2NXA0_9HEXA|nr:unnamed protein product [Allacma fusca]